MHENEIWSTIVFLSDEVRYYWMTCYKDRILDDGYCEYESQAIAERNAYLDVAYSKLKGIVEEERR